MEKEFDLKRILFAPASGSLSGYLFEESHGLFVPTPENFNDKRVEGNTLALAQNEVIADLRRFTLFNGESRRLSGAKEKLDKMAESLASFL